MTIEDVLRHFGTCYRVAKDVGFAQNTPRNWRKIGYIPIDAQARIQEFTNGILKLNFKDAHAYKGRD